LHLAQNLLAITAALKKGASMNEDLPPHLRERSGQPEPQPQLPLELPLDEELIPPPTVEEPQRPPEPFLRRS